LEESVRAGAGSIVVVEQPEPKGYGDAIYCARPYVAGKPFLHLVGDHFYLPPSAAGTDPKSLLRMLVDLHEAEGTSVSTVHPTPESLLGYFGAVGGKILRSAAPVPIYEVETVLEKPTPTQGEQELVVPGVRSGQYLCFYGLHLFTPALMQVLDESAAAGQPIPTLSVAMQRLVQRERLLAAVLPGRRFDLGRKYGLLQAQLALALSGPDRAEVLALMLEQAAQ